MSKVFLIQQQKIYIFKHQKSIQVNIEIKKCQKVINTFSSELNHITTAIDIYSLGMVTLEVSVNRYLI
jgi:hypothetical protein